MKVTANRYILFVYAQKEYAENYGRYFQQFLMSAQTAYNSSAAWWSLQSVLSTSFRDSGFQIVVSANVSPDTSNQW